MNIYELFAQIAPAEALPGLELLASGQLPKEEAKALALQIWKVTAPPAPNGKRHLPESFWGQMSSKCVWWALWGFRQSEKTAWLECNIHRANSRTLFIPQAAMPMPTARNF